MWTTILLKVLPYGLVLSVGMTLGIVLEQKVLSADPVAVPPCPDCKCPEPTVAVQPFDFEGKIKGVKTINYSPQFSGSISVAGVDSTALEKMIERSMQKSFDRFNVKRRR